MVDRIVEPRGTVFVLIDKAKEAGFSFPNKELKMFYLFIRAWLEEQDVFIHIKKYPEMRNPNNKYLFEVRYGTRLHTPTVAFASANPTEALEKALVWSFNNITWLDPDNK